MTIKNIKQAFKILYKDQKDITLTCTYWERFEVHTFRARVYAYECRYGAFKHAVKCIKNDFKDISTYYSGNKKDCEFKFSYALDT